jgi:hypothetical protein
MQAHPVPLFDGPTCLCGALVDDRQTECRKCRARGRWQRRATGRARRAADLLVTLAVLVVTAA